MFSVLSIRPKGGILKTVNSTFIDINNISDSSNSLKFLATIDSDRVLKSIVNLSKLFSGFWIRLMLGCDLKAAYNRPYTLNAASVKFC